MPLLLERSPVCQTAEMRPRNVATHREDTSATLLRKPFWNITFGIDVAATVEYGRNKVSQLRTVTIYRENTSPTVTTREQQHVKSVTDGRQNLGFDIVRINLGLVFV